MCMFEWTSIPAASGLTRLSPADEAGTGTTSDLSRDLLSLAGFLGFLDSFGSSLGITMGVSGLSHRGGERTQAPRAKRGIGDA